MVLENQLFSVSLVEIQSYTLFFLEQQLKSGAQFGLHFWISQDVLFSLEQQAVVSRLMIGTQKLLSPLLLLVCQGLDLLVCRAQ